MESTNSRQAAFVVNRKVEESTNNIQNITFGLEAHKSNEECNATDEGASGSMEVQTTVNRVLLTIITIINQSDHNYIFSSIKMRITVILVFCHLL